MVRIGEAISAKTLKAKFLGLEENSKTLLQVFQYHNDQITELSGISYAPATIQRQDIALNHIKYSFITNLEHYLRTIRKCNNNTTYKYIKNF